MFCALYSDRESHFWLTPKVGLRANWDTSRYRNSVISGIIPKYLISDKEPVSDFSSYRPSGTFAHRKSNLFNPPLRRFPCLGSPVEGPLVKRKTHTTLTATPAFCRA